MNATAPAARMQESPYAHPQPDARDAEILADFYAARLALYAAQTEPAPLEGDWLILPDGERRRIAHSHDGCPESEWGPAIPPAVQPCKGGSFALSKGGHVSMSGTLDSGIRADRLTLQTDADGAPVLADADVWFFHHDWWTAHNSVHAWIPVRVWEVQP